MSAPTPDAAAAPAAAPSSGGAKVWLPLIANLVVMPCVAYVLAVYVILPKLESRMGQQEGGAGAKPAAAHHASGHHEAAKEKVTVSLAEKLVVNVSGSLGTRYLVARVTLVGSNPELKELVEKHDAQLRDAASNVLANKSLADLERPGARNIIKTELMTSFTPILGEGAVDEIYFSDFAVQ